jgi:enamine deaminase RidA (YjgF/YER057c/UK114 family)
MSTPTDHDRHLPLPIAPADWPPGRGYAHALLGRGRVLAISGQVGWDPAIEVFASDDFASQADQALANIVAVVKAAGGTPENVVRLTWFITDRVEYLDCREALGAAYRSRFGRHYPAMSVVVVRELLEPRAKLEIEATALLADD